MCRLGMNPVRAFSAVLLLLALGASPLHAWAMGLPPLTEKEKKSAFKGVKGLTHHRTRVNGMWSNGIETYSYSGNMIELQDFLDHFGALKDDHVAKKELIVGKGPQMVRPIGGKDPAVKCNWRMMTSHTNMWRHRNQPKVEGEKEGMILRVTILQGDGIDLKKLNLPKGITVLDKSDDA